MKFSKALKKVLMTMFLGPLVPLIKADNVAGEVKFANTVVQVNSETVAKVTKFARQVKIAEEDITGAEDVIAGTNVLRNEFTSIAVSETASIEGIAIETAASGLDDGQSELRDAAESGQTVTIIQTRNTGYGWNLSGFFTSYEEEGSTGGPYTFKGDFRVNSKTEVTPAS